MYYSLHTQKRHVYTANQHVRMISKGSCDTEDWGNDAVNSALITGNKLHLKNIKNGFSLVFKKKEKKTNIHFLQYFFNKKILKK